MNSRKKLLSVVMAVAILFSMSAPALAAGDNVLLIAPAPAAVSSPLPAAGEDGTVTLYTNDVHTYIDGGIRYSHVAALKDYYEDQGAEVILVDAGDAIQGTAYGSMDKGKTIIALMNAVGYDVATLGNHEFDYGMEGAMNAIEWAEFPYVSCNFYHEKNGVAGETVLTPYKVFQHGETKVAFLGITTPETFTKSTPAYFQDKDGNYIYGIAGGEDGGELYAAVQKAVDAAKLEAEFVCVIGHLGDDPASKPWTSEEVIANTTGIDVFIDGHSHSTVEKKEVLNKTGEVVSLTQTGEYLNAIGLQICGENNEFHLITAEDLAAAGITPDPEVAALEEDWISEIDTQLGQVIGYAGVTFDNYDAEGKRLVRSQETNTGDFAADALMYLFSDMGLDVDFAIMNGGGIRNKAVTGELTYKTMKEIHTFGNVACLITVTGQQILDALEWGAKSAGGAENGGFLHTAGLKYTIDTTIPSTVQADDKGVWTGGPTGAYRVKDVMVADKEKGWLPLDLEARYNLAGYNYTLRDLGDGYAMFAGAVNVLDYVMEDYMVLANYVKAFPVEKGLPTIKGDSFPWADYSTTNGSGRITILTAPAAPAEPEVPAQPEPPAQSGTYTVAAGDTLWKIAHQTYGKGALWTTVYEANKAVIADPDLIYIGQTLVLPAA